MRIEHFWAGALRRAVVEGDVENGSLMAGQSVGMVTAEQPVGDILGRTGRAGPRGPAAASLMPRRGLMPATSGSGTRRLLTRLRALMAAGTHDGPGMLQALTQLVAGELVAEVCSIYAMRPGDMLELSATYGLRRESVGRTRLRVGEGIVGLVAATGAMQNLPDAQNHPAFAYRPETGEDPYASLLAVPVRRAGRTLGVIAVQNRAPRRYAEDECEVLETVAMLLAEVLPGVGASDGAEQGCRLHVAAAVRREHAGTGDRHRAGRAARPGRRPAAHAGRRHRCRTGPAEDRGGDHAPVARGPDRTTPARMARSRGRCWRPRAWWRPMVVGCGGCARRWAAGFRPRLPCTG